MRKVSNWLRRAFGFSKAEANGIVILLPLMLVILLAPYGYHYYIINYDPPEIEGPVVSKLYLKLKEDEREDSVSRVKKWRTRKSDVKKTIKKSTSIPLKVIIKKETPYVLQPFDINKADTLQLRSIKGIGKVLSSRILKYRKLLGGFTSKRQMKEVYGLQDSVLMALDSLIFIEESFLPIQLSINNASEYTLKKHPYINATQAKAIYNYRYQHGRFTTVDDLKRVHLLDSALSDKLAPYIVFE